MSPPRPRGESANLESKQGVFVNLESKKRVLCEPKV